MVIIGKCTIGDISGFSGLKLMLNFDSVLMEFVFSPRKDERMTEK